MANAGDEDWEDSDNAWERGDIFISGSYLVCFEKCNILPSDMIENIVITWCRHQMEAFSALLALWAGSSTVTGEFPSQRPVTRSFGVYVLLKGRELS